MLQVVVKATITEEVLSIRLSCRFASLPRSNSNGSLVSTCLSSRVPLSLPEACSASRHAPNVQPQEGDRHPELLSSEGCGLYVVSHSCQHQREVLAGFSCVGLDHAIPDTHRMQNNAGGSCPRLETCGPRVKES